MVREPCETRLLCIWRLHSITVTWTLSAASPAYRSLAWVCYKQVAPVRMGGYTFRGTRQVAVSGSVRVSHMQELICIQVHEPVVHVTVIPVACLVDGHLLGRPLNSRVGHKSGVYKVLQVITDGYGAVVLSQVYVVNAQPPARSLLLPI